MKSLANINKNLFLLIPILPLVSIGVFYYGMHLPRILLFWFIVSFAISIATLQRFISKNYTFKLNLLTIFLFIYWFVFFLTSLTANSPTASFYSDFNRMDGFVAYSYLCFFFLVYSHENFKKYQWELMSKISCSVALTVAILAIAQNNFDGVYRAAGTFANPLTMAIYLIFHVFLSMIFFVMKHNAMKRRWIIYVIGGIIVLTYFAGIIYSLSRSGFLSIIIGFFAVIFYLVFIQRNISKQYIFTTVLFAICTGVIFFSLSKAHLLSRITNFSISENSSSARFELWKNTVKGVSDKPFLGWGKENFVYFFVKHYSNKLSNAGDWYDRSHNFLLDKLIEQGFLGFVSYIILLSSIVIILLKQKHIPINQKACLFGFLCSYICFHLTSFESFTSTIILFCILIYLSQSIDYKEVVVRKWLFLSISTSISILCFYLLFTTTRTYIQWNMISTDTSKKQVYKSYNNLINEAKIGKYDLILNFDLLKSTSFNDSSTRTYYFELAEANTVNLLNSYPNHPVLLSQLGLLQMKKGNLEKAIITYEKLKKLAPKRHMNLMDLGMLYAQNNETKKALKVFDEIITMDNNYEPAQISKAFCLLLEGDSTKCWQIIEKISVNSIVDNFDRVVEIYNKLNRTEKLLKRIENATSDEKLGVFTPNTFKNWLELAVKLRSNSSIKRSILECLYVYKVPYNKNELETLIVGIQKNNFSTDVFFDKFDGQLVK